MTTQMAKVYLGGNTYTVIAEMDKDSGRVIMFRVYKAWNEYRPGTWPLKHKVQIGKENNLFQALMDITGDIMKKPMVMIPTEYLKELQALKNT